VIFSGLPPSQSARPVDLNELHYREQTLVGSYGCCFQDGVDALELLASGKVEVADMITHRLALWDMATALDLVERKESLKILLYP
jgi:L-iditol 2-dehydrogenase